MRKLYLFMMVSLDGYFEGEDHDLSWHNVDAEFNDFAHQQLRESDAILFGKRTYDMMAGFWPTPAGEKGDKETADVMTALPKYVASDIAFDATWNNTTVLTGDVAAEVAKLKTQPGKDIALFGSNMLCVSLMEKNLVDEFRLMTSPVAIGKGTPLFAGLKKRATFDLLDSQVFKNGNVLSRYATRSS